MYPTDKPPSWISEACFVIFLLMALVVLAFAIIRHCNNQPVRTEGFFTAENIQMSRFGNNL